MTENLIPLYLDRDANRILIVDGPHKGKVVTLGEGGRPPVRIELILEAPFSVADLMGPPTRAPRASYEPVLDAQGHPSREDDGTLIYRHVG